MEKKEFLKIRKHLGKTQRKMAQLLGVSLKAVQSFEQGWRNIPYHVERQLLFLLANADCDQSLNRNCWACHKCGPERRSKCPAWEYQEGHLCWFINGNFCHGVQQKNWKVKMTYCRQCEVFKTQFPGL